MYCAFVKIINHYREREGVQTQLSLNPSKTSCNHGVGFGLDWPIFL